MNVVHSNTPFFEGVQQQKNPPKNPRNALSDTLLMSRFQKIVAGASVKHNPSTALPYLIDGQTVVATAPASSDYLAHKLGTECVSAVRGCICMYSHCKQTIVYAASPHFLEAV